MLANMPDKHLPDPDARPIAEERETVLRAGWGRLKPRCQELLSLLISDDPVGYKDLSKLLQMPVGSIGPTRARCLEHLRRLVEEEGMSDHSRIGTLAERKGRSPERISPRTGGSYNPMPHVSRCVAARAAFPGHVVLAGLPGRHNRSSTVSIAGVA